MKRSGRHHAHAETTLLAPCGTACGFERVVVLRERRARTIKENLPRFSQLDPARLAAKELNVELGFDGLDPLAKRRLLYAEPLRGPHDVPFFGDGDEVPEMSQL